MFSFSIVEFLSVLKSYNLAIWPLQIFTYILIIIALFYSFKPAAYAPKIVLSILSFLWLFNGIVFSFLFWSPSHIFGYFFGICFVIQGIIFLSGIKKPDIKTGSLNKTHLIVGILLVIYATFGYQLFGYYLGHIYPKFFAVGLVPCPTTILTFGIFFIFSSIPFKYYIVPLIISFGGFLPAYNGIYEDVGLVITGVLGIVLLIKRDLHSNIVKIKTT